ncbi:hypothetical protein M2G63_19945 [Vibrio vulnificus]|nr:hypothetical protein [Vibrio vulnificus]MCU8541493.1 hypothetical protein [Vibrio vulnificus]
MAKFDFTTLYSQVPEAIEAMGSEFNSHELILEIAQNNQREYIEALAAYRNSKHPFMHVHKQLSTYLRKFENDKLKCLGHKPSRDIFGKPNTCLAWKKYT